MEARFEGVGVLSMRAACSLFQGGKSEGQGSIAACHKQLAAKGLAAHAAASLHDLTKQYEGPGCSCLLRSLREPADAKFHPE